MGHGSSEVLMLGDKTIQLGPLDDSFHAPQTPDPLWNETTWFSFSVPERAIQGYVYPWVRPSQSLYGGGVIIWDDRGHLPWDALWWDWAWNLPLSELGDLRDFTFPTGIRIRCLEPLTAYHLSYERPGCTLDLTFRALIEPHVVGRSDWDAAFSAHFDQPGRLTGHLILEDERIPVDCYSMRDRSWGPRVEDPNFRLGWDHGQTASDAFLAYSAPDEPGSPVTRGFLWREGTAAELVSGTRRIERGEGGAPTSIVIGAEDALGRRLEAVGRCVNGMAFLATPWMFTWNCLTRWEFSGVVGWGELQDTWHLERFRAFRRSRNASTPAREG
jgi:hypothetical protein